MRLARVSATLLASLLVAGCVLIPSLARADLLAYEGFDYPVGDLSDLDGGFGWSNPWDVGNDGTVVAGSLDYSDGTDNLPTIGNHVVISGENGTATAARAMTSSLGLESGTYWMSFVGQRLTPHPDTPNNYARAAAFQTQLIGSGSTEQFSVGKATTPVSGTVTQTWDAFSINSTAAAGSSVSTGVDQATQVFAVMEVTVVGGTDDADDDIVNVWINPSLDENTPLGAPDAVNTGIDDYQFDGIRLFAGNTTDDGLYAQLAIDEIRIGTELVDVLSATTPVPGDTDGDGTVEPSDLTPIRNNYRQNVSLRSQGDLNVDGVVNFRDFREWKTGLLAGGGTLEGLQLDFLSVPEPSGIALALAGCVVVGWRRRRTRSMMLAVAAAGCLLTGVPAHAQVGIAPIGDGYTGNDPNRGPAANGDRNEASAFFEVRHHLTAPRKKIGYLKYDIGGLEPALFDDAILTGAFAGDPHDHHGAGTWNIYGLNDGELNLDDVPDGSFGEANWMEEQLSYGQGLGVDVTVATEPDSDLGIDLTEVTLLGTITLTGDETFSSNAADLPLGSFLSADTNGVVTFLITDAGGSGTEWRVQAMENEGGPGVQLAIDCMLGDTNCDGDVDVETDLAAIAANFRQDGRARAEGDLTGDQFVDFDDFDQWKSNFTGSLEGADLSFLTAVPEPGSFALAIVLMMTCAGARPSRRQDPPEPVHSL